MKIPALRERIEREDLVMFINASFACTRQSEFYSDVSGQSLSIEFLHAYILGNYRRLYARTLAAGINHFNQALIVLNLLQSGSPADPASKQEEATLIRAALSRLPPQRVLNLIETLRLRRVNNRRTRAAIRVWVAARTDSAFDAVKYRRKLRVAARHAHLKLKGEVSRFLFSMKQQKTFETPLFETFRRAHYDMSAVFELPFTVAEGLAARHKIPRDKFLAGIEPQLTALEKLRLQKAAAEDDNETAFDLDLSKVPLTRLALYILSLPLATRRDRQDELHRALEGAATRALRRAPARLGKVAAILDSSWSMSGSSEKRRRPLAVALGTSYLLRAAAREYHAFWTRPPEHEVLIHARGPTRLADPLIDALEWGAELILVVSDGFENDPPEAARTVARAYKLRHPDRTELIHLNPVFDAEHYAPRAIGPAFATVGVRDAEDVPTMIGFARFADGHAPLAELESYLASRMSDFTTERS